MKLFYILPLIFALVSGKESSSSVREVSAWIESTRTTSWGEWDAEALCPEGAFVTGFRLKVQADQGLIRDDTALNAVELICTLPGETPTHIVSGEGARGNWGTYFECADGGRANGFQLRSEGLNFDNTAGNNLAIYCDGVRLEGNGHGWGDWTERLNCPSGTYICGIRTQIAIGLPTVNDDTALNNVDMACCTVD